MAMSSNYSAVYGPNAIIGGKKKKVKKVKSKKVKGKGKKKK